MKARAAHSEYMDDLCHFSVSPVTGFKVTEILAKPSESIRIASVSKYVGVVALPKMTDERTEKTVVTLP